MVYTSASHPNEFVYEQDNLVSVKDPSDIMAAATNNGQFVSQQHLQ